MLSISGSVFMTLTAGLALIDGVVAVDCCTKLNQALPARVYLPGSSSYNSLNTRRWSNTSILAPSCIVTPASAKEVSTAVKTLVKSNCVFAIKSGGHNANAKFNNINNGVTLDLKLLNTATVAADKSYVTLGSGTTMGQAYAAIANHGIAIPGGICDGVGVGGISTGGGQSFFLPKVGWVVDNILNYEVVLASGEIVTANKRRNSDLYKALKGGSTNFGIVTKVEVAAFPHDGFWGGQLVVPATEAIAHQVLERVANFTTANNDDVDAAIMIVALYTPDGRRIIDIGLASTANIEKPNILAPFFDIKPVALDTVGTKSLSEFVTEVTQPMPDGYRELTATLTVKNDLETLLQVQAVSDALYDSIKDQVPGLDWMFSYNPQPKILTTHAAKNGGNSLGLENLQHDQILFWLVPRWTDAASDALMHATAAKWEREVNKIAAKLGTADPFVYLNHAGYFQKPFCGYGSKSLKNLKKVAKKYDPDHVFQRLVPGGHKVSTSC